MTYYNIEIKLIMLRTVNSHMLNCLSTSWNSVPTPPRLVKIISTMPQIEILINESPGSSSAQLVPAWLTPVLLLCIMQFLDFLRTTALPGQQVLPHTQSGLAFVFYGGNWGTEQFGPLTPKATYDPQGASSCPWLVRGCSSLLFLFEESGPLTNLTLDISE